MSEMNPEGSSEGGKGDDISPEEAMIESLVEKLELSLDTAIKKVKMSPKWHQNRAGHHNSGTRRACAALIHFCFGVSVS